MHRSVSCISKWIMQCVVCNVRCANCNLQCAVCSVRLFILMCSVQCVVCSGLFVMCSMQFAACSVQRAVCSVQCAECSVQRAVSSVQCIVCSVQCSSQRVKLGLVAANRICRGQWRDAHLHIFTDFDNDNDRKQHNQIFQATLCSSWESSQSSSALPSDPSNYDFHI